MARLSTAITSEELHKLEAIAICNVQSMKNDVSGWTFGQVSAPKMYERKGGIQCVGWFFDCACRTGLQGAMSAKSVADITCAAYKCGARNMNAYELTLAAGDDLRSL